MVSEGKETRTIDGKQYILEHAIKGDFSLIRAHKADKAGNLVYRGNMRHFNVSSATASRVTVAEVDEIVEMGDLDPDKIITPGIYVNRIVCRPREFRGK